MGVCTKSSYFVPNDAVTIIPEPPTRTIDLVHDPSRKLGLFQVRFTAVKMCRVPGGYLAPVYYTKVYEITAKRYQELKELLENGEIAYRTMMNGGSVHTYDNYIAKGRYR